MEAASTDAASQGFLARALRAETLLALGLVLAVAVYQLWLDASNPPGFLPDEASMSYNAWLIAHHLKDENGGFLPLYFVSFGDYKSPIFTYVLAAVFRVTGAHSSTARELSAAGILAAVLLLGLLARRRTGSTAIGLTVVVLAGLTPWLYEVGRAAFEVGLEPLFICLFLLAVESAWRQRAWTVWHGIAAGLGLTGIAFVYAAGRLLAPLFAIALLAFAARGRWRWLLATWATFGITAVAPIAVYWVQHPDALTSRYNQTTFITNDMSVWTIVGQTISHYVHDTNIWFWITEGDFKPYVHTRGAGSIFASVVVLALVSVGLAIYRRRADRFWLFTLLLLFLAPIPGALTKDRHYALRLVPLPVLLLVVALPGMAWLFQQLRTSWAARAAAVALTGLVAFQFVHFYDNFRQRGPERRIAYHAAVPQMLRDGFSEEQILHVNHNEPQALAYAKWYAVEHGIPRSRIRYLGSDDIPVPGAVVFGRFEPCAFVCNKLVELDEFWLGRSGGAIGGDVDLRSSPPTLVVNTARGSGLKVSFLAQGHVVQGGSAWGYLLRVRQNGKPWRGAILIQVLDGAGNVVDGVGEYSFKGSRLAGYYWPPEDEGKLLHFRITLQGNDKTLGTIDYGVAVRHKYVK